MYLLALMALALGQQPCPYASKSCPQAQAQRCCQEAKGCLVKAEAEDEIDMGEAEFLADPMDDQVIAAEPAKPKNTISLGLGWGKDKPIAITVVYTKKKEEAGKEERIQGQFYTFGPVVTRCEVTIRSEDEDEEETCEECPAAKAAACEKCPDAKAAVCDKCPAVKTAACEKCPATKAAACDKCPAVKAATCGKCEGEKCGSGKPCDSCAQCPGEKKTAAVAATGAIVQTQAVSATSATVVATPGNDGGKPARRRWIRRR